MTLEYILDQQLYTLKVYEDEIYQRCIMVSNLLDIYKDASTSGVEYMYPGLEANVGSILETIKRVLKNLWNFAQKYYHKFINWLSSKAKIIKDKFFKADQATQQTQNNGNPRKDYYKYANNADQKKQQPNQAQNNNQQQNQQALPQHQQNQPQSQQQPQQQEQPQQEQIDESWKSVKVLTQESYQKVSGLVSELLTTCRKTIFTTHGPDALNTVKQNAHACAVLNENIEEIINNDQTHIEWGKIASSGNMPEYYKAAHKVADNIERIEKMIFNLTKHNAEMLKICNRTIQEVQSGKDTDSNVEVWQLLLQHVNKCNTYLNKARLFISTTEQIADLYMKTLTAETNSQ